MAEVTHQVNHPPLGHLGAHPNEPLQRPVLAAVVDHHHLECQTQRPAARDDAPDQLWNDLLLVENGRNDGQDGSFGHAARPPAFLFHSSVRRSASSKLMHASSPNSVRARAVEGT